MALMSSPSNLSYQTLELNTRIVVSKTALISLTFNVAILKKAEDVKERSVMSIKVRL